ncbi:hypothetical protein HBH76_058240 [Parastagonospora nodorum]|nr:hypothetical protein HBH76_058240 [Parastagonospora nodorum]
MIPLMYERAARTLCWIGIESPSSLRTLIAMTCRSQDFETMVSESFSSADIYHSTQRIRDRHLRHAGTVLPGIDPIICARVDEFLNEMYFKRLWIVQDIVCSKNPVIYDGADDIPWSQFARVLLFWLLYVPATTLRSSSTMVAILAEAMRCGYHDLRGSRISLSDILLSLRSCQASVVYSGDYVNVGYSIAKYLEQEPSQLKLPLNLEGTSDQGNYRASQDLNTTSGQPLSFSLVDDTVRHLPSWIPDWTIRTKRFLLNHPASRFAASSHVSSADLYGVIFGASTTQRATIEFIGMKVDVISDTSEYMPPRRHCDHYTVSGDNCYFYTEWFDFARSVMPNTRNDANVMLDYADTVQARGCSHIWEDLSSSDQTRLDRAQEFLNFIENSEAEETESIQIFYAACYPCHDRRFAVTRSGRFCLVPKASRSGDLVCIPHGSRVPYIFRPSVHISGYQNIGEAYVHRMMNGESREMSTLTEHFTLD